MENKHFPCHRAVKCLSIGLFYQTSYRMCSNTLSPRVMILITSLCFPINFMYHVALGGACHVLRDRSNPFNGSETFLIQNNQYSTLLKLQLSFSIRALCRQLREHNKPFTHEGMVIPVTQQTVHSNGSGLAMNLNPSRRELIDSSFSQHWNPFSTYANKAGGQPKLKAIKWLHSRFSNNPTNHIIRENNRRSIKYLFITDQFLLISSPCQLQTNN